MIDIYINNLMPYLKAIKNHPELALGVIVFCFAILMMMTLLWLIRVIRRRPSAKPLSAMHEPIFGASINGHAPGGAMSHRSLDELLSIEDSLKALRELYHRKLIPVEVYVKESQKYAESL